MRAKYGEPLRWLEQHVTYAGDDCLEWPFGKNRKGYGFVRVGAARHPAHRVMCLLAHGAPEDGKTDAAHRCGNPSCCNPAHLYHATVRENIEDKRKHGTLVRGDRVVGSKLNEQAVTEIRRRCGQGESYSALARQFGVTPQAARRAAVGQSWAWLVERPNNSNS